MDFVSFLKGADGLHGVLLFFLFFELKVKGLDFIGPRVVRV